MRSASILGKTVFHLVGLNRTVEQVVRKKFSRTQLLRFTANVEVDLIGMEACTSSHFLCRALREQGHEVRLMPARYVKPFVKTSENDFIDAEAIAEAVNRPSMENGAQLIPSWPGASAPTKAECICADRNAKLIFRL